MAGIIVDTIKNSQQNSILSGYKTKTTEQLSRGW